MNIGVRLVRAAASAAVLAVGLQGIGTFVLGPSAGANTVVKTTATVNVRKAPGTSAAVLGVVGKGGTITATGPSSNGWTPVTYNGRAAYISSQYLTTLGTTTSSSGGSSGKATTLERLNVRTGPGTSYSVVTVLAAGASVSLTGQTSNGFSQITYGSTTRWVSTAWITTSSSGSSSLPAVVGQRRATAALILRSASGASFTSYGDVPAGTILDITGVQENGRAQIVYGGAVRWVTAQYLAATTSGPTAGSLPAVTGTRYATTALNIWTTATGTGVQVEVPKGSPLAITGVQQSGRAQIVYGNTVRWVTAQYLSTTQPTANTGDSSGLSGLTPTASAIVAASRANFPQIVTYYGKRVEPGSDHNDGRAVDIMLPNYKNNKALGDAIAAYFQARASQMNITYIIFNQHIWSVARASEGWRYMADRGSDTQNHLDHVHVSVAS